MSKIVKTQLYKVIDDINTICKEKQECLLLHQTKLDFLESILKDGGLLPLRQRKDIDGHKDLGPEFFNFGGDISSEGSQYKNYKDSIFMTFKTPNYNIDNFTFRGLEVCFIIDPYSLEDKTLESSFLCQGWNWSVFDEGRCKRYNTELSVTSNLKEWISFMEQEYKELEEHRIKDKSGADPSVLRMIDSLNELVIQHKDGVNFDKILKKNPKGVIILINLSEIDKENKKIARKIMKKYKESYQWILV